MLTFIQAQALLQKIKGQSPEQVFQLGAQEFGLDASIDKKRLFKKLAPHIHPDKYPDATAELIPVINELFGIVFDSYVQLALPKKQVIAIRAFPHDSLHEVMFGSYFKVDCGFYTFLIIEKEINSPLYCFSYEKRGFDKFLGKMHFSGYKGGGGKIGVLADITTNPQYSSLLIALASTEGKYKDWTKQQFTEQLLSEYKQFKSEKFNSQGLSAVILKPKIPKFDNIFSEKADDLFTIAFATEELYHNALIAARMHEDPRQISTSQLMLVDRTPEARASGTQSVAIIEISMDKNDPVSQYLRHIQIKAQQYDQQNPSSFDKIRHKISQFFARIASFFITIFTWVKSMLFSKARSKKNPTIVVDEAFLPPPSAVEQKCAVYGASLLLELGCPTDAPVSTNITERFGGNDSAPSAPSPIIT